MLAGRQQGVNRQRQRSGNRGGRHHEYIRIGALVSQRGTLLDTEPVLLIDDCQAQPAERKPLLNERLGADNQVQFPLRGTIVNITSYRSRHASGDQPNFRTQLVRQFSVKFRQAAQVLLRQ